MLRLHIVKNLNLLAASDIGDDHVMRKWQEENFDW